EDGMRYLHVTGVQACALPISDEAAAVVAHRDEESLDEAGLHGLVRDHRVGGRRLDPENAGAPQQARRQRRRGGGRSTVLGGEARSEERRVGEERGSRVAAARW